MGLWHRRIINIKRADLKSEDKDHSLFYSQNIDLEQGGSLALFSTPYSLNTQDKQQLKIKNNIYLALDGKINNFKQSFNVANEVISLYKTEGSEGLHKLEGMFSLILYDKQKQITLLFRSFLNGYPLYYVAKNNLLTVSSNPVYLLRRSDVSDTLDEKQMSLIFSYASSQWSGSVFSEITELKHGEMVIITPNKIEHKERSLSEILIPVAYGSEVEVIKKYRDLIEKSVEESLLPNVKHGIMLSSGMDSSTLAVFASKILHQQNRELTAYSWTLPNDLAGDESEKIKELCKMIKIPLKIFNGEKFGPFDTLDDLLLLPDTPYTNPFWSITAEVYRRASEDGTGVLLNGNYADVLFPGSSTLLVDILRDKKFELFMPAFKSIVKQTGYRDALKKSPALRGLFKHFLPNIRSKKVRHQAPEWLSKSAKENHKVAFSEFRSRNIEKGFENFSTALSSFQTGYLGIERHLSGSYGIKRIESHRNMELLNYSLNIPTYMTYRDGQMKYFAREAMRGLLPESIRMQPRVGDLNLFMQNSYARNKKQIREMLLDDRSVWREYVDETWMENKLKSTDTLIYADFLVFWLSLNMQQWTKAIKPGGSLYEGKFTQRYKR